MKISRRNSQLQFRSDDRLHDRVVSRTETFRKRNAGDRRGIQRCDGQDCRVISDPTPSACSPKRTPGVYDAMNKGLHLFGGDVVGFLNSDDTFHDSAVLGYIAAEMQDADIVYGDLNMVTDHSTKRTVRAMARLEIHRRYAFQLGWVPPHPTFYMRREVAEKVGDYDLSYITTADYDYMLRALALNNFRRALPAAHDRRLSDGWHQHQRPRCNHQGKSRVPAAAARALECAPIDPAFFLRCQSDISASLLYSRAFSSNAMFRRKLCRS